MTKIVSALVIVVASAPSLALAAEVKCKFNSSSFSHELNGSEMTAFSRTFGEKEVFVSVSNGKIFHLGITDWAESARVGHGVPNSASSGTRGSAYADLVTSMGVLVCNISKE